MRLPFMPLLAACGLAGCLSDATKPDPYSSMTCDQKIAAIALEIQKYQAAQAPAAKLSARAADSTQLDTAKPDSTKKPIQLFRGYPAVAGLDPATPEFEISMNDSRDSGSGQDGTSTGVLWIAPVGFNTQTPSSGTLPDTPSLTPETTTPTVMPKSISTVQIVTRSAYKAHVRVYDFRDALIREFRQEFGYQGELGNSNRMVPTGLVSFLVWDNQDASGRMVPSGVYQWRVRLEMESGEVSEETTKIGLIGEECSPVP